MTEQIPNNLDKSHKESLVSRINYGNEYSLRKRLGELVSSLGEEIKAIISPRPDYFSTTIVDARNYFTHYDSSLTSSELKGRGLYDANQRLKILLIIHL